MYTRGLAVHRDLSRIEGALRLKVLLHEGPDDLYIHEGKIGEEFGISRTPVRQVLQVLSAEGLLQTQPGKGSYAVVLDKANQRRDLMVHADVVAICAKHCVHPVPMDRRFGLMALSASTEEMRKDVNSVQMFARHMLDIHQALHPLVDDPVLWNCHNASYFRLARWRVDAFKSAPEKMWERVSAVTSALATAAQSDEQGEVFWVLNRFARTSITALDDGRDQTAFHLPSSRTA